VALTEWIPVGAAAFATAFLSMPLLMRTASDYVRWCAFAIVLNAVVGVMGFAFHIWSDFHGPAPTARENFLYGAPAFAPLLFTNLSLLAGLGLWALRCSHAGSAEVSMTDPGSAILPQQ
jgi:hypothetical protein